jgi:hypothetical protein
MFLFVPADLYSQRPPDGDEPMHKQRRFGGVSSSTRRLLAQHKRCRSVDWANDSQPAPPAKIPPPKPQIAETDAIPLHSSRGANSRKPPRPNENIIHKTTQSGELTLTLPELGESADINLKSSFSPPTVFEDMRDHEAIREQQIALNNDRTNQRLMSIIQKKEKLAETIVTQQQPIELAFEKRPIQVATQPAGMIHFNLQNNPTRSNHMIHKQTNVLVFVPHKEGGVHRIKLTISEKSTGQEMIQIAIEQYTKETGKQPISTHFILRAAESDGSIDHDFPSMDRNTTLQRLGFKSFVLVPDKSPQPVRINSPPSAEEDLHNIIHDRKEVDNRLFLEDIRLEVLTDFGVTGAIVPVAPDVLIRDLLKVVCHHYEFKDAEEKYLLRFRMNDGRSVHIPDGIKLLTSKFLKHHKVLLSTAKKTAPVARERKESIIELLLPSAPISYREYSVIKINKYGRRQERILGIDSQKIYNKMPHFVTTFLGAPAKTRVPERPIHTLLTVITEPDKPLKFATVFDDETLYWEAQTNVEAQEIINTLQTLVRGAEQDRRLKQLASSDVSKNSKAILSRLSQRFFGEKSPNTPTAPSALQSTTLHIPPPQIHTSSKNLKL